MADKKISALTAATTPLAGTEVLPIVQGGATVKVAVSNLTAGRAISLGSSSQITGGGLLKLGIATGNAGAATQFNGWSSPSYGNWQIDNVYGLGPAGALNFTPSDTGGGTTYTGNPAFYIMAATGAYSSTGFTALTGNFTFSTAAKGINFTANTPAAGMTSQLLNWYEEGTWTPTDVSGAGLSLTIPANSTKYTRKGRETTYMAWISFPVTASIVAAEIGGIPFAALNGYAGNGVSFYSTAGFQVFARLNTTSSFNLVKNDNTTVTNVMLTGSTLAVQFTVFS